MYSKNQIKKIDNMIKLIIFMYGSYKHDALEYITENILNKFPGITYVINDDDYYDLGYMVIDKNIRIIDDENYLLKNLSKCVYSDDKEYFKDIKKRFDFAVYI